MNSDHLVSISKKTYNLPADVCLPEESTSSIFIPAFAAHYKHHYYLVNLKDRNIVHWKADFSGIVSRLRAEFANYENLDYYLWNQNSLDELFEAGFYPHSAEYHRGKIYVSFMEGTFILELDLKTESCRLICEQKDDMRKMYCSTNQIYDGNIYFSRWGIEDTFKRTENNDYPVKLEIGRYSIDDDRFDIVDIIEGPDEIHTTSVSPDGENILMLEFCQKPKIRYPKNPDSASNETMTKVLNEGLIDSHLISYNMPKRTYRTLAVKNSPAHIEFDLLDKNIFYVVQHNVATNADRLVCFGDTAVDKFRIEEGTISLVDQYKFDGVYRSPSHKLFQYDGKQYMVIAEFPNQAVILDPADMTLHKKIAFSKTISQPDFSRGPFAFPVASLDKTPYGIIPENNTPYIYLCSVWNLAVYDFVNERRVAPIIFNTDAEPLINIQHPNRFLID